MGAASESQQEAGACDGGALCRCGLPVPLGPGRDSRSGVQPAGEQGAPSAGAPHRQRLLQAVRSFAQLLTGPSFFQDLGWSACLTFARVD